MNASRIRRALVTFLALIVTPAATHAASPLAPAVRGVVKDSTGRPLPNVQVRVTELGRVASTNEAGEFVFRGLPGGTFHLTATLIGYRPVHTDVHVPESGEDVRVQITMAATPLRLSAVNVAASPTGLDVQSQSVAELSGGALQRSVGATLAQTLSAEPGLAVRFMGPAATMPVIRGLTGDRVLVLQDGQRAADLSSATSDHATTVDPFRSQRIEIVRGPASLLYGNNALGGVVNVVTNDIPTSVPTHVDGYVGGLAESAASGATISAGATVPLSDAWAFSVRGSGHSASSLKVGGGSTLDNTQSRNWSGGGALGWIGANATAGLSLSNYAFNYGLPHPPDDDEVAHIQGRRQSVALRAAINAASARLHDWKLDATAQDYQHDEVEADGAIGTAFHLRTQTVGLTARTDAGRWHGTVGVQGLFKQYAATGAEALTPAANSRAWGAFIYQELPLTGEGGHDERAVTLQLGARIDTYGIQSKAGDPKFGPATTVNLNSPSGSVGLSVPVSEHLTLSGSAAQAFRAPTVEELFSNAVHAANADYEVGNPGLETEKNQGVDGQLRWQSPRATLAVSGYYNRINDYVFADVTRDTTVNGETMPLAVYAQKDAQLRGYEASAELRVTDRVVLGAMGDYTRGSFRDGSGPLPFMPSGRVGASLRWDDGRFNVGGDVRHALEQTDTTGGADVATEAYTLFNLAAGFTVIAGGRVHALTLRVDNATDAKYFDATSRIKEFSPNPGRNVALVYKVLF